MNHNMIIYLANLEYPFNDLRNVHEWKKRIAMRTNPKKVLEFKIIGSVLTPEVKKYNVGARLMIGPMNHTIEIREAEANNTTWKEYNTNKIYLLWFYHDGFLYGGPSGITCRTNLKHGLIKWESKTYPERIKL